MINRLIIWIFIGIILGFMILICQDAGLMEFRRDIDLKQFENSDVPVILSKEIKNFITIAQIVGFFGWIFLGYLLLKKDVVVMFNKYFKGLAVLLLLFSMSGCWRPYEPVKLEELGTNEEGFLIPYTGDSTKQTASNNEEFLTKNMVSVKQIKIPQQWIQTGYKPWMGHWADAAKLIKVDKSPVTREWTADENTGTSNKKEAIWVMTSDQVEFSTGWTCTARIQSKDDAVKFLHNYPNGVLSAVLDAELRGQIQTRFGMEVTDLPMDELRKNATPHLRKVIEEVDAFFLPRGITVTNLGISGGFVYKNTSIQEKLVEVFNSEQQKNIEIAKTQAQDEANKRVISEANGKATALLLEKNAEASGIKAVADAKAYELEKAKQDLKTYLALKQLEVDTKRIEKWTGTYPTTFMGKDSPDLLLTTPINK
jgi:regulator of protease activity HflC (stomatin/prohibitin superfamily)